eukprot:TRINITY_DN13611_c0_g1_i2.p1 TRINITY_DN13611_c0_g1~~TRINITY_DN13611_c0_g1_i2.p1  ORF type:complete len:422 (-),score=38.99 TRINITY_DN13611_c0_g1_i2:188-1453(-)
MSYLAMFACRHRRLSGVFRIFAAAVVTAAVYLTCIETCRVNVLSSGSRAALSGRVSTLWLNGFDQAEIERIHGELLVIAGSVLDAAKMSWWIYAGTLLSMGRAVHFNQQFARMIPWDKDIDVMILESEVNRLSTGNFFSLFDSTKFELLVVDSVHHSQLDPVGVGYIPARLVHQQTGYTVDFISVHQLGNAAKHVDPCSVKNVDLDPGYPWDGRAPPCTPQKISSLGRCRAACRNASGIGVARDRQRPRCEFWWWTASSHCFFCSEERWSRRVISTKPHFGGPGVCQDDQAPEPPLVTRWSMGESGCVHCQRLDADVRPIRRRLVLPFSAFLPTVPCALPWRPPDEGLRAMTPNCPHDTQRLIETQFGATWWEVPGFGLCTVSKRNNAYLEVFGAALALAVLTWHLLHSKFTRVERPDRPD